MSRSKMNLTLYADTVACVGGLNGGAIDIDRGDELNISMEDTDNVYNMASALSGLYGDDMTLGQIIERCTAPIAPILAAT